ncbi:MAG: ECF-type riboflavin transporter substrate-binding protein [Lactococcus lactis]|jgi:energy-coupling factor transport system substrate-specific component|nr:ECF-type riboflavin transporter substrate-binding protein [Lactococcus lactis]
MKNNSVKIVVATGIGAALFVIIGWLINIPTPIPNTSIQLQYAVLALFSALFGPLAGFLIGFIGHALKDSFLYGAPWWTWVLGSGLMGLFLAFGVKRETLTQGIFGNKEIIRFNIVQFLANVVVWGIIAPVGDVLVYSEPANKVFTQGIVAGLVNALTIAVAGTLLLKLYAATRTKSGSLDKE